MTEALGAPVLTDTSTDLVLQVVQLTDVGLVRSENQDFAILSTPERVVSTSGRGRLMVVADGMGGHRGGATASKLAGTTIRNEFLDTEETDVSAALRSAMTNANAEIFAAAQENADLRGMGTTCSALIVRGRYAWFGHVGDSRIYMVRGGEIIQLTQDHSLVASMVREGLLTSQEAEVHPRRNVLQRSMGVSETVEIDVSAAIPIEAGDTFLLCSDGLHGLVKQAEMLEVISAMPLEDAGHEFIKLAIERGAHDNVTVILARVELGATTIPNTLETEKTTEKIVALNDDEPKPAPKGRSLAKWIVLALIVALAAGAIAYWIPWNILFADPRHFRR